MTMARVEDGQVVEVGLPEEFRTLAPEQLKSRGWFLVEGMRPEEVPEPGYQWTYAAPWTFDGRRVQGTPVKTQRPKPYPSWSFVEGTGWVAPVAKPEDGKEYQWDEAAQTWEEIAPLGEA